MKVSAPAFLTTALLSSVMPLSAFAATPNGDSALAVAIAGPQRTPAFKARDRYRHPLRTLEFFGIRSDMTVIEVLPGGGWWTEILAPYLKQHGHLIEATAPTSVKGSFSHRMAVKFEQKLKSNSQVYGDVALIPFEPPAYMPLGAPGSADMVLTFDNTHDLVYSSIHGTVTDVIMQRFFRDAYQVLKPGGVLGLVAHRAPAGTNVANTVAAGRVPQGYVIAEARKAGFKLGGTSEVNANPKDTSQYPVWDLPPTLREGSKDRAKLLAIGESDAMTLRFVKPKS